MLAIALVLGFLASAHGQGSFTLGAMSDGSKSLTSRVRVGGNDDATVSAFGSVARPSGDITKGLALDTAAGHGLSLSHGTTSFGSQMTGAGRVNLLDNGNHKLDAGAFLTRNMPSKYPGVPNFNTVGGNVDYMFKDRIGASLGASRTPFLQRTDLSAGGKLNLYRAPSSSLDLSAGLQRTITPQFTNTQPFAGVSFTKFFGRNKK